ncbi:hypothetical protein D9M71_209200 [compost metagenome]
MRPAVDALRHQLVDMFECDFLLTVRVGNFLITLPLAEQECLAAYFGRQFRDALHVALLHGQDQVCLVQDFSAQLSALMVGVVTTMLTQYFQRSAVHAFADEGVNTGRAHLDAASGKLAFEQGFGSWAAANVADANDQNFIEHRGLHRLRYQM